MNVSVYSEMRLRQIQFEFCLSAREERSICRQEKDNRERVGGGGGGGSFTILTCSCSSFTFSLVYVSILCIMGVLISQTFCLLESPLGGQYLIFPSSIY